ncbi:MAG: heme-binding protein [Candidatus Binataceae bacterium]
MLASFFYYLVTAAEAALSVFGIRSFYEQPRYRVVERLGDEIEIRTYGPRLTVETTVEAPDSRTAENEAFRLLLSYIAGANRGGARLAMTAPVEETSQPSFIAMTAPVEITDKRSDRVTMRFFLPSAVAVKGAPEPADNRVRIVEVAPSTLAVLRFSGRLSEDVEARQSKQLIDVVKRSTWRQTGAPFLLAYDPPFTIPFLRRNEVAVAVTQR